MNKISRFHFILMVPGIILFACNKSFKKEKDLENMVEIRKNILKDSAELSSNQWKINNNIFGVHSLSIGVRSYAVKNTDYIANAYITDEDSIHVWINNYKNGISNGILIGISDQKYNLKSVDPSALKGINTD